MKKRLFPILIFILVLFAMLPLQSKAAGYEYTDETGIKWRYTLDAEGFATVTDCLDTSRQELTVPSLMDGHRVLYIGDRALRGYDWVTAITLPKDIVSIGKDAFFNCSSLQSITIPEGVTSIGNSAFGGCESLTSITIPDRVTSIGEHIFYGCSKLNSVTLGNGITAIPEDAFRNCSSLASITIPEGVTSIGKSAFNGCKSLVSVTIPDRVTSIGEHLFFSCSKLNSVTLGNGIPAIPESAFRNCGSLTSITIPDSVTSIGEYAFASCVELKYLSLPNSVTPGSEITIGENAFFTNAYSKIVYGPENPTAEEYFKKISNITYRTLGKDCLTYTLNNNTCTITYCDSNVVCPSFPIPAKIEGCPVTGIAAKAFKDCKGIKGIEIPDTVTSIGDFAFSGCTGLTSLTIPQSVESIGNSAFADCTGLTSVQIGNGVTSIGKSVFQNCSGLSSVSLPQSVKKIGEAAFAGCKGLGLITIPDSVEEIGASAFSGCTGLETITIPEKVTDIYYNTFSGCTGLVSVSLPDGLTVIDDAAFKDCTGLTSLALPDKVTWIVDSAFEGCESLTAVTIPCGVTRIRQSAFKNCAGLETVVLPKCERIDNYAFSGIADNAVFYYPGTRTEWEAVTKGTDAVPASCTVRTYDDQTETVVVNVSGIEGDNGDQLILTDGLGTRREITEPGSYGVWPKDTKLTVKAGEGRRYEGTLAYQQADGSMAFSSPISDKSSPPLELALNKGTPCVNLTFDNNEGTRLYRLRVNEQILDDLGTKPSWKIKSDGQEYKNGDVLYKESGEIALVKNFTLELTIPEGYACEGGIYGAKGSRIVEITNETTYNFNNVSVLDEDVDLSLVWYEAGARNTATVNGGSGSGKYRKGDNVSITADAPAEGKVFDRWTGPDGVSFADATSATTTFTMPDTDVTVTATYKDMETVAAPTFAPAGGTFYTAQNVSLASATEGTTIYYTTDGSEPSINSRKYTEAIPVAETATIKAIAVKKNMKDSEVSEAVYTITEEPIWSLIAGAPPFDAVTVGYTQPAAKAITIKNTGNRAATISNVTLSGEGQDAFLLNRTTGTTIGVGATDNTTYTIQPMGELAAGTYKAEVVIVYDNGKEERAAVSFTVNPPTYTVTVKNGSGGDAYTEGSSVTITAASPAEGKRFKEWIGNVDRVTFTEGNATTATAVFTMPAQALTFEATYEDIPTPPVETYTVTFKTGDGIWIDGTTEDKKVTVEKGQAATAPEDPEREGFTFDGWDTDFSNVTTDLTVTAKWKENTTPAVKVSIENAKVVLSGTVFTYNTKVQKPDIKTIKGLTLKEGTDYTIEWSDKDSRNAGTYTVTITGKYPYIGTTKATYTINPAANPMKLKAKTATVKYSKLKNKTQTIKRAKAITVSKAKGKPSYKFVSAKKSKKSFKKFFKIDAKTGNVTVKKGLEKGTYKVTVKVKAKGNSNYKPSAWKKVTFKVVVK